MSPDDEMALVRQRLDALEEMPEAIRAAHAFSTRHRKTIGLSRRVGCFFCLEIYPPEAIKDWTDDDQTAICPKCGVDAVLPDAAVAGLSRDVLDSMNKHWF